MWLGAPPGVRSVEVQTPPASPTSSHLGPRLTPGGLLASFDKSILQVRFVFVCKLLPGLCRVSCGFMSVLQHHILEIMSSHKCLTDMGPILDGYIVTDV